MNRCLFLLCFVALCLIGCNLTQAQSPYISRVYEYMPAPGQFVNKLPLYEPGDTRNDMRLKTEECIADNERIMISLGGYGGYVVFGFDHMVENVPGKYDFKVLGNAFVADANPNSEASKEGGSSEPGIVMVSYDTNGNGRPDDEWYELAGSEYYKSQTIHNYRITYERPDENKVRTPDNSYQYLNDTTYIRWTDNQGKRGYVYRNTFHDQSYYPQWIEQDELVFEGTKLADNYVDESGVGSYYVQYAYHWGYVDNQPNTDDRSNFNIEWAVDGDGNPVALPGIHFVKVYTGVNQYCGWLGETSTEVMGAEDLHLLGIDIDVPVFTESISIDYSELSLKKNETILLTATISPTNATNQRVTWESTDKTVATVSNGLVTAVGEGEAKIRAIAHDGYLIASCLVKVNGTTDIASIANNNIRVYYHANILYTEGLEGFDCSLYSIDSHHISEFTVRQGKYEKNLSLRTGVYILKAQKAGEVKTFKLLIK